MSWVWRVASFSEYDGFSGLVEDGVSIVFAQPFFELPGLGGNVKNHVFKLSCTRTILGTILGGLVRQRDIWYRRRERATRSMAKRFYAANSFKGWVVGSGNRSRRNQGTSRRLRYWPNTLSSRTSATSSGVWGAALYSRTAETVIAFLRASAGSIKESGPDESDEMFARSENSDTCKVFGDAEGWGRVPGLPLGRLREPRTLPM